MSVRLSHVTVTASDFAASLAFYDAVFAALGCPRLAEFGDEEEDAAPVEAAAWGPVDGPPLLWLVSGRVRTGGVHLALRAAGREDVSAFHTAAVAAGGVSHDAPRRWVLFRRGEFHAIVIDPDGNLIEAVSSE